MKIYKNVIVTGGCGFLGTNFVHYLVKQGVENIVVIDCLNYAANRKNIENLKNVTLKVVNISKFKKIERIIKKILKKISSQDIAIVHFAAESHNDRSILNPRIFLQSNIIGTFNLLEICRKYNIRIHHISTDEVYGDLPLEQKNLKFTLDSRYAPSSPYSSTKAGSDMLVNAWVRTFNVKATISNCSNNYGPYQHIEKFIPRQITNILSGLKPKLYGNGLNVRDWIHVEDHCSAIFNILTNGIIGKTYLVGINNEKSNIDVLKIILKSMDKKDDDFDYVDDRVGHDVRYAIDASKLVQELGWKPKYTDFEIGIISTIKWYKDNENWWKSKKSKVESFYKKSNQ